MSDDVIQDAFGKGYRKAAEDVFDALKHHKIQGLWWSVIQDELYPPEGTDIEGVPDEEPPKE